MKIIHIDDNRDDLELTEIQLKRRIGGLEIQKFTSADEALDSIPRLPADCILSDYQMPVMNGLELLRSLRSKNLQIPFILLTGQGNEEVAREALRLGANDYFTKDEGMVHYERLVNSINRANRERQIALQREKAMEELKLREEGYSILLQQTGTGIFRVDMEQPMPIDLPVEEQIELIYRYSILAEANDAMATMYGYDKPEDLVGKYLRELHGGSEDEVNVETHRQFIDNGYKTINAVSREVDKHGNAKEFYNTVVGIVEDGKLVRIWGSQAEKRL